VRDFVDRVVTELGRLDVMFANAGIAHSAPFLEHPEPSAPRAARQPHRRLLLLPGRRPPDGQAGRRRIIATASINGVRGVENLVGYNVAKAGVIELTKTMAVELAKHHIAVNAIAPAQIDTRSRGACPRRRGGAASTASRWTLGDVDEVARAALFLASDDASYITGHTLAVDGGYLAGGLWSR